MRKVLTLMFALVFSLQASAQLLTIEKVRWDGLSYKSGYGKGSVVYLSNGENLYYNIYGMWEVLGSNPRRVIATNLCIGGYYPRGTMIQKIGDTYNVVGMYKVADKTIEYAKVREISTSFSAELNGNFSYNSFLLIGGGSGQISGKASGGTQTIVNIVFTDKSTVSIAASEDPIWLEAKKDMRVEHYKVGTLNVYKLLFD